MPRIVSWLRATFVSLPVLLLAQYASAQVFINEIHYDNSGTDTGEAIEVAAAAGTDLTGWTIVLYNGSTGVVYGSTTNLSGMVAGFMTKSNILGYVAAFPNPEVIRGINAFALGARAVNPKVEVRVVWTKTWYDPATEKEAAKSLLDVGADVIAQHQDSPGPQEAAQEKGVYSIGYNSDMSKFAPKAQLTAPIWNWGPLYSRVARQVSDGTWKSESIWWGMKEDLVRLAPISAKVPAEVKALVEERAAAIKAGTLHPFTGPVTDQDGTVQIAAGSTADDGHLLGMSYFVKGVQGTIPK